MADYIYTMELRLTPNQQKGVTMVQDIARAAGMNVYLTGGAVRDIISGLPIRDLDFTVQGNPLKLQKEFERAGAVIGGTGDDSQTIYITLPGGVRAEVSSARTERYEKTGRPPIVAPASIIEDLRRRDFTVNAIALSLNPGSRGLLMDPFNGAADIEAKLLRILHNYAFVEDPSRLIRASRFSARFHWPLEERTQARYDSAKENNYIEYIRNQAIGYELEQLAYEDDPLNVVRVLEKEGWLKVLNAHWTTAKVDTNGLSHLMKTWPEMTELLITPQLPEYPKIAEEVFMLLLDGKLRSRTEILKFLKPLAPPPPPPPPPPRRGRGAKAAAAPVAVPPTAAKKKGKGAAVP